MSTPDAVGAPAVASTPGLALYDLAHERFGARSVDVVDAQRGGTLAADRDGDRGPGAARAEQHHAFAGERYRSSPERFDAAQPVEDVRAPAAIRGPGQRIDGPHRLRLTAQRLRKRARLHLIGNREHQSPEVLQPLQLRQDHSEVLGQHMQRNEDRVDAAATKLRREHFRRANLRNRVSDDAEYARPAGNIVDLVRCLHDMRGCMVVKSPDDGAGA